MKFLIVFLFSLILSNQVLAQEDTIQEPVEQQEESYQGQEDLEAEKNYVTEEPVEEAPQEQEVQDY